MVDENCAYHASRVLDVEAVLDDLGPAVMVGGTRVPVTAAALRLLGRQALAVASAVEGVPLEQEPPVEVEPFARIWPARLPVEAGIPDDLWCDRSLRLRSRFVWASMWRLHPALTGRAPRWRGRVSFLVEHLGRRWSSQQSVRDALTELKAQGWISVRERAERPSGYGEIEVELHLRRRPDAPGAGTVETTAVDASRRGVKSDE